MMNGWVQAWTGAWTSEWGMGDEGMGSRGDG